MTQGKKYILGSATQCKKNIGKLDCIRREVYSDLIRFENLPLQLKI